MYKPKFVLFGILLLTIGILSHYVDPSIAIREFLIDPMGLLTPPDIIIHYKSPNAVMDYDKYIGIGVEIVSVAADLAGLLAIIYGFTSKKKGA